ncbi:hypothetical protein VBY75_11275 [Idiomarina sp. HB]|uniref:hypothetical protein n=1 Tax=Idiomarina sp. HB TaxID=3110479 RepID=UPI003A81289E
MENIDKTKEIQESLFDNSLSTSLFFVTTQRNLMSFLGAGMLVPASAQFRYKKDSREHFGGAIPFWKGGIPSSGYYKDILSDERSVIVECHTDDITKYSGRFIKAENEQLLVVNAPVPLLTVTAFHMPSRSIIDDFVMRVPEDVVLDSSIFKVAKDISYFEKADIPDIGKINTIEPQLNFLDSIGGGVKALLKFMSDEISDYTYIRDLLNLCLTSYSNTHLKAKKPNLSRSTSKVSESDQAIIFSLLPILRDIKFEDGIDPVSLLDKLVFSLEAQASELGEDTLKWAQYVKRAIEGEQEVPALADERDIFKRSVLLFLLRPDIERLEKVKSSSISPGPAVLSIAAFLAGFSLGLTRMGPDYKGEYRSFNRFTKSLIDSLWCKSHLALNIVLEPTPYGTAEVYEVNREVLLKLEVRQNVVLARVLNQAKSAGYDLQYNYENQELYYAFDMGKGRKQTIYIELITPLAPGFDVIRFVSPCMDLSGKNRNKLKKDVAVDFLKRNCVESMYCGFAYSERRKAIVAQAMQIVRTMDDDEFVTLLKYVAKVADEYESDVLNKDIY